MNSDSFNGALRSMAMSALAAEVSEALDLPIGKLKDGLVIQTPSWVLAFKDSGEILLWVDSVLKVHYKSSMKIPEQGEIGEIIEVLGRHLPVGFL